VEWQQVKGLQAEGKWGPPGRHSRNRAPRR